MRENEIGDDEPEGGRSEGVISDDDDDGDSCEEEEIAVEREGEEMLTEEEIDALAAEIADEQMAKIAALKEEEDELPWKTDLNSMKALFPNMVRVLEEERTKSL